jgi:hypothetical protein
MYPPPPLNNDPSRRDPPDLIGWFARLVVAIIALAVFLPLLWWFATSFVFTGQ